MGKKVYHKQKRLSTRARKWKIKCSWMKANKAKRSKIKTSLCVWIHLFFLSSIEILELEYILLIWLLFCASIISWCEFGEILYKFFLLLYDISCCEWCFVIPCNWIFGNIGFYVICNMKRANEIDISFIFHGKTNIFFIQWKCIRATGRVNIFFL